MVRADVQIRVDDERGTRLPSFAFMRMDHPVWPRHGTVGIGHDGESDRRVLRLVDILHPFQMFGDRVDREPKGLHVKFGKGTGKLRGAPDLGSADGSEIARVASSSVECSA